MSAIGPDEVDVFAPCGLDKRLLCFGWHEIIILCRDDNHRTGGDPGDPVDCFERWPVNQEQRAARDYAAQELVLDMATARVHHPGQVLGAAVQQPHA